MMLADFLFLLLLTAVDGESSRTTCSYEVVLQHLNLTKNKDFFSMIRPVKDHTTATEVSLDIAVYAILDVKETDQKFVPYIWTVMQWENDFIRWDTKKFCDIESINLPAEVLWKPDVTILEVTEKDKVTPSPYLTIFYDGLIVVKNDQVLVSTCRMRVYKFPFDIQRCNLTFKSVLHSVSEIELKPISDSKVATELSKGFMEIEYEWWFKEIIVTNITFKLFEFKQDRVVYTISMQRRSALYIANFLLPILFFLCLDLASFLISDTGGEKLGYKMTVLLAVTVMQLILNDILPSSSDRIPLIAVYCIGVFTLMLASLLETILVMYLMEKDNETDRDQGMSEDGGDKEGKTSFHCCEGEGKKWTPCACLSDVSADELPAVPLKASRSQLTEEQQDSEMRLDELKEGLKALSLVLSNRKEDEKTSYWTKKAKMINKIYFRFYVTAAMLFLISMAVAWFYDN